MAKHGLLANEFEVQLGWDNDCEIYIYDKPYQKHSTNFLLIIL